MRLSNSWTLERPFGIFSHWGYGYMSGEPSVLNPYQSELDVSLWILEEA